MEVEIKINCGSWFQPKRCKDYPHGQDCHFYSNERKIFGVADGVGGYSKFGIDSGIYAREFISNTINAIDELFKPNNDMPHESNMPHQVMKMAFEKTTALGASTACIVSIKGQDIRAANIGDSGFVVLRSGKLIYHCPEQCRSFNRPFQLGPTAQNPNDAHRACLTNVEPGDMIVVATDGVFDNLFDDEIALAVRQAKKYGLGPQLTAQLIAYMALWASKYPDCETPFMLKHLAAGLGNRRGGKRDDITVVVADVQASDVEEKPPEAMKEDAMRWKDDVVWLLTTIETKSLIRKMKANRKHKKCKYEEKKD